MIVTNAVWCDKSHKAFDVQIEDSAFGSVPYTFAINSDFKSDIYLEIEKLYKSGELLIREGSYESDSELAAESIRSHRNILLDETDKFMTIDYPISKEDQDNLKVYRQALRDITAQEGFPDNITWPEKPTIHKLK